MPSTTRIGSTSFTATSSPRTSCCTTGRRWSPISASRWLSKALAVLAGVEHAVMRALEKLPADRFENAKEFIDAVGREGQPTVARPGALAARTGGVGAGGSEVGVTACD